MEKKYEHLKEQYPEYISVNQFYKICHIAKRSAVYLLEHGVVPYTDTGKITWKYKIALSDVIVYLQGREKSGSMIPRGAVNNKRKYPRKSKEEQVTFQSKINSDEEYLIKEYFEHIFADCPDVLTPSAVANLIGFCVNTIRKNIQMGALKSIVYSNKYIIPKVYLMDFLLSKSFTCAYSPSDTFKQLLDGFVTWKNTRNTIDKNEGEKNESGNSVL